MEATSYNSRNTRLQSLLRARPPMMKSTEELEKEELEKAPNIFEDKGELGLFYKKRQVTVQQEFSLSIDERIPLPTASVNELFDKILTTQNRFLGTLHPILTIFILRHELESERFISCHSTLLTRRKVLRNRCSGIDFDPLWMQRRLQEESSCND
ncbi:protein TPX2 [Artemisia annua]|uniref:Protein TPX2 n=1 Tax=Artemisia annua TaxID=35608 RepID=A0A2U1NK80_ARTAN|nr:protein TPX2 [Artemisia annua]